MRVPLAAAPAPVDASGAPLLPSDRGGEERLRRLRLVALFVPASFLVLVLVFRGALVGSFSPEHGHVLIDGILVVGTLAFSLVMFALIDRSYRELLQENRDLAAVDTVAVAARAAYTVDEVARTCLEVVLEVTGADGIRIVAAHPADPHRRPDTWHRSSATSTGAEETVPLMSGPEAVGSLTLTGLRTEETSLSPAAYAGIGRAVGSALQRARYLTLLQQESHDATRAERDRIAREMHDGLAQALGATHFRLLALAGHPDVVASPEVRDEVTDLADTCQDAYTDVREAILGLRESGRGDRGLMPSLESYVEKFTRRSGIPTTLRSTCDTLTLPPHHEIQVIRVVQEALTNVRKHSQASSAQVLLETGPDAVVVTVEDDGRGFDPQSVGGDHYGLATMRERTQLIDGWLTVDTAPGDGTRIVLGIPSGRAGTPTPETDA